MKNLKQNEKLDEKLKNCTTVNIELIMWASCRTELDTKTLIQIRYCNLVSQYLVRQRGVLSSRQQCSDQWQAPFGMLRMQMSPIFS